MSLSPNIFFSTLQAVAMKFLE